MVRRIFYGLIASIVSLAGTLVVIEVTLRILGVGNDSYVRPGTPWPRASSRRGSRRSSTRFRRAPGPRRRAIPVVQFARNTA